MLYFKIHLVEYEIAFDYFLQMVFRVFEVYIKMQNPFKSNAHHYRKVILWEVKMMYKKIFFFGYLAVSAVDDNIDEIT